MDKLPTTKLLSLILCLLLCASLGACGRKPVYLPPADIYDNANSDYQGIRVPMEELARRAGDTTTWYDENAAEQSSNKEMVKRLATLAVGQHVPSMYLFGSLLIAGHTGYFGSGGWAGSFKKQYRQLSKRSGLSRSQFEAELAKEREAGLNYLVLSARYGYPRAISKLQELGETVPSIDLDTPREQEARVAHQQQLAKYEEEKKAFGKLLGATIAAAGAAYVASKYGGTGANTSPPTYNTLVPVDDDYQGCCSWHRGISRDLYGNVQCHWTRKVLCKDYEPSPTCFCE